MGCIQSAERASAPSGSRAEGSEAPNVFYVRNIDEDSTDVSEGHLKLGADAVELSQPGKDLLRWPHRCLRRYGYNGDLFSFESGRQCSTGPGIFAFRCDRAEELYNCLEENIRMLNNNGSGAVPNGAANGNHRPVATANGVAGQHRGANGGSGLGSRIANGHHGNGVQPGPLTVMQQSIPRYETAFPPDVAANYLTPTSTATPTPPSSATSGPHVYINSHLPNVEEEARPDHSYMNTCLSGGKPATVSSGVGDGKDSAIAPPPPRSAMGSANSDTASNNGATRTQTPSSRGSTDVFQYPNTAARSRPPPRAGQTLPPLAPASAHQNGSSQQHHQPLLYLTLDLSDSKPGSVSSGGGPTSGSTQPGSGAKGQGPGGSGSSSEDDLFQGQNGAANFSPPPVPAPNGNAGRGVAGAMVKINYQPEPSGPAAPAPPKYDQYTEIDFPKTEALNKKTVNGNDHGGRKTRHDSSADDR